MQTPTAAAPECAFSMEAAQAVLDAKDVLIASLKARLVRAEIMSTDNLGVPPIPYVFGQRTAQDVAAEYASMPAGEAKTAFFDKHSHAIWKANEQRTQN